jgi:putative copper export protein
VTGPIGAPLVLDFLAAALTHWIAFLSLAALIGTLALDLLVLPLAPELRAGRRRLQVLGVACAVLLGLASIAEAVIRGRTMTGAGLPAVLGALPVIFRSTHFGHIWLLRLTLVALILCSASFGRRGARMLALAGAIGVAFTTAVTGHAGDWGDRSLTALVDWIHVVATSSWVGGLISLSIAGGSGMMAAWPPTLFETIARRFSRMAGWSLLGVVVSGGYNVWTQVRMPAAMWSTPYGRVLSLKLLLVLILIGLGALARYTIVARLPDRRASGRLFAYVSREACLGLVVLACTAVLVHLMPARHAMHAEHHAAGPPGSHAPAGEKTSFSLSPSRGGREGE